MRLTSGARKCKIESMKKIFIALCAIFVFTIGINPVCAYVERPNAVVTILDKTSGKTHTATIPVGHEAKYEKLNMVVRSCKQTDPFVAENAYMFIEISTASDGQIFGGWMNKNEPGENPLQNADFDLWLVRCE